VQVPAGEIGVVISQVGQPVAIGAKSATYKPEFGNFTDLKKILDSGGQKGVQRPVLAPGTLAPIHPIGFLVITSSRVYGVPIDPVLKKETESGKVLTPDVFSVGPNKKLSADKLKVTRIEPPPDGVDVVGIVTTYEGEPLPEGDIASRLGGFCEIENLENAGTDNIKLI
jgi:hypothetical protein